MQDAKCKICRRAGEKLFLKGERCFTPKCAIVRKPYPPGIHRQRSRRGLSEYGTQLREKQKLRNLYHVREEQFVTYIEQATAKKGDAGMYLLELLERRLDSVVFQAGFAQSRSIARQAVSHGHIQVNGAKVTIPSFRTRPGDVITIASRSAGKGLWYNLDIQMKKYSPPAWLTLEKEKRQATVTALPDMREQSSLYNTRHIIEFYAR